MSEPTKYRVEIKEPKQLIVRPWKGPASDYRLAEYIREFNKSLEPGGENYHMVMARGYKPVILSARIVTEKRRKVVAEWKGYTLMHDHSQV